MSNVIPMKTCVNAGWRLSEEISKVLEKLRQSEPPESYEIYGVQEAAEKFETILNAELQVMDIYFVSQKALYSTQDLIERAEIIFPAAIRIKVPDETLQEIKQAGKCLAFELATAAGFHILRATEDIIREYYGLVVGTLPAKKSRNWGVYIKGLKTHGADQKIVAALEQVKDMHRNPIMHPEVVLTTDEAISLFGIAQGIIVAMVVDIEKRKAAAAATASVAAVLPPPVLPPANP